jgi:formate hydrogenlyase transcriptional activator
MSTLSNAVTQLDGYPESAPLRTSLYPAQESAVDAFASKIEHTQPSSLDAVVGRHGGLRAVLAQVEAVASTKATVLITGETGTGKEVIARAIHELSGRHGGNLVKVNCAAMPAGLFESELFGHKRGAFTDAVTTRVGRFALADRGTLFLDEIGDMPLGLQPKLLRVLQDQEFEPVGSTYSTRADVRVIAATNRDLSQMVRDREFRDDLYYRLILFPIALPPLRERRGDIPELVRFFVKQYGDSMGKPIDTIPLGTMRALVRHSWPGNVRELENYVARGVILSKDGVVDATPPEECNPAKVLNPNATLEDKIRQEILTACQRAHWRLGGPGGAAERLGLKRTTLFYKMKKLGIAAPPTDIEE